MTGMGRGMNHGRSSPAGFIGIHRTGHTHTDHLADRTSGKTADGRRPCKRIGKNRSKGSRNFWKLYQDHADSHQDVENAHKGHQLAENGSNPLRSAAGNHIGQDAQQDSHQDYSFNGNSAQLKIRQAECAGYHLGRRQVG